MEASIPEVVIEIAKEDIKFSAGHFTIFADGSRERLHGHNYRVRLLARYALVGDDMSVDYGELKKALRRVCARYDEYMLLPANSRYLRLVRADGSVEALIGGDRFVFPEGDVRVLPVANITGEALAGLLRSEFLAELESRAVPLPESCEIGVGSGDGQWVTSLG